MGVSMRAISENETVSKNEAVSMFMLATIVVLSIGFWIIDHRWDQSVFAAGMDELAYTGAENATADRLSDVNAASTASRLVILGWAFLCFLTGKQKVTWNSTFLWISVLFAVLLASSVLWSINPKHTIFKLAVLLVLTVSAFGLASRFTLRQMLNIICCTCLSFVVIGVVAEIAHGTFRPWGNYRFIGTCHPNTLAVYAAVMCMSARMYIVKDQSTLIAMSMLAVGVVVIMMTKSRTTLGAVVISMLATQIVSVRGNNRILLIAFGFFAIGLVSIGTLFLSQQATGQLGSIVAMGRADDVSSLTGRLPLWEELLSWIDKRPFLGYGYMAFWDADRVEKLSELFKWEIPHGHNMYLDIMLDIGIIGLIAYSIWFFSALQRALKLFIKTNAIEFAIGFGIGVFALISGCAESLFKIPTFHLFILISCFCGLLFEQPSESSAK